MKKSTRWAWIVALVVGTGFALVLAFVVSLTTEGRSFYERNFVWLFWLNVAVAALLVLVILLATARLVVRLRRGKFGSRLLFKLAGIFALVGVLPGLLIYTTSYQFVSRSIEVWFDARVEGALDAGITLGRGTLDALVNDLGSKTRLAAERLGETRSTPSALALERLREQLGAQDVTLLNANGQILAVAGASASRIAPERPSPTLLRLVRVTRVESRLEGLDDEPPPGTTTPSARVRAVALVPNPDITLGAEDRFLVVVQAVPALVAANALAVQSAYREYQQRALARDGLRKMYIGTLTLVLILAVFGAVLLAAVLGNQLARPLLLLAEGMREVAKGDLGAKRVFSSRDELGGLTRSFAAMTEQLGQARSEVERGVARAGGGAHAPADHPRQPDRRRHRVRSRAPHRHREPGRHAHPAAAAVGVPRAPAGRRGAAGGLRPVDLAALRAPHVQPRARRARPVAGRLRAADGAGQRHAHAPRARRRAAGRRAADRLRRHHRGRLRAALGRLERGGAPARPRDQEPAHAHPALGRAAAAQARSQARGRQTRPCCGAPSPPSSRRCRR